MGGRVRLKNDIRLVITEIGGTYTEIIILFFMLSTYIVGHFYVKSQEENKLYLGEGRSYSETVYPLALEHSWH